MHVWPTFAQLNDFAEFCSMIWTYLLKMCKKPIQIDVLDSCLGKEDADARFGTFATYKGARRSGFIYFSVLFYCVTKSFNTYFKNWY